VFGWEVTEPHPVASRHRVSTKQFASWSLILLFKRTGEFLTLPPNHSALCRDLPASFCFPVCPSAKKIFANQNGDPHAKEVRSVGPDHRQASPPGRRPGTQVHESCRPGRRAGFVIVLDQGDLEAPVTRRIALPSVTEDRIGPEAELGRQEFSTEKSWFALGCVPIACIRHAVFLWRSWPSWSYHLV